MLEVALVSREFHPFGGGGIGTYLNALARVLEPIARVTLLTTTWHEDRYRELVASGDARLPRGMRVVFVEEPPFGEAGSFYSGDHLWGSRVNDALLGLYPGGGPDLVEIQDYRGEGCVIAQANHARVPGLRNATVCVRINTTAEFGSILDGHLGTDYGIDATLHMERLSLRYADRLLWAGGDILASYQRHYGTDALAPTVRVRHPLVLDDVAKATRDADLAAVPAVRPLKLLYFGRLERRKGVQNLLRAVTGVGAYPWTLTMVGSDTPTAPLRHSLRDQLERMTADDERIQFRDWVPRRDVARLILDHDAVLMPSPWECWPSVALEALILNRPVIANRTGGPAEIVRPGRSGWHARHPDVVSLTSLLERLASRREEVTELIASGRPRRYGLELVDPDEIRRDYEQLAAEPKRFPTPGQRAKPGPLVSVVIPYHRMHRHVREAVESAFAQTHRRLEVIVVNDGSFEPEDMIIAQLAAELPLRVLTQPNSGLGPARNAGIAVSRGKYVFPLDADNIAEPELVARCTELLEADDDIAYVTPWSRYIDEDGAAHAGTASGYQPLGNSSSMIERKNVGGDASAVLRRRIFDLGFWYSADVHSFEDWMLYRMLARAGMYGCVIPERLMRYRIREQSMVREIGFPREQRLAEEMEAQLLEREIVWGS